MQNQEARIIQFERELSLSEKLDSLFLEDPIAVLRLIEYCHNPYEIRCRLDDATIDKLVEKGLIHEAPMIPTELRELILATTSVT